MVQERTGETAQRSRATGTLHRAVQVLEVLRSSSGQGRSIRQIAEHTGLSKSAVQRLLRELTELGLASQDLATRKYQLGHRILTLAADYRRNLDVRNIALTHMVRLRDATGETIGLTLCLNDYIMHIEQVESLQKLRATFDVGQRLPLWSGAPSRVFLAELSDEEVRTILDRRSPADITPVNPPDLETEIQEIHQVRTTGYAVAFEETTTGVNTLSAPIRGSSAELVATLSITAPSGRLNAGDADRSAPGLIAAADAISDELGWPGR